MASKVILLFLKTSHMSKQFNVYFSYKLRTIRLIIKATIYQMKFSNQVTNSIFMPYLVSVFKSFTVQNKVHNINALIWFQKFFCNQFLTNFLIFYFYYYCHCVKFQILVTEVLPYIGRILICYLILELRYTFDYSSN